MERRKANLRIKLLQQLSMSAHLSPSLMPHLSLHGDPVLGRNVATFFTAYLGSWECRAPFLIR